MKPKSSPNSAPQAPLFGILLDRIVDPQHPLVQLARKIDWTTLERHFSEPFSEAAGAPAKPVRLMAGLQYLKHTFNLSDELVVSRWIENPYWQYFCGELVFQHEIPIHPTSMTKWRKTIGPDGLEKLLAATVATAFETKLITPKSLQHINVDTTVQEKTIAYPTDAALLHRMREKLVKLANRFGVILRQSYERVGKKLFVTCARLFHRRNLKAAKRALRTLKTYLRRVRNDIARKIEGDRVLEKIFKHWLAMADRLLAQKPGDKKKLYSIHAPEVECISKGKTRKKYEFGNKASIASTSKEGVVVAALGVHGNPYDGHTLTPTLEQAKRILGQVVDGHVHVDLGYRGHGYEGPAEIHVCGFGVRVPKKARRTRSQRKWDKRRAAIEPLIGHMKNDGRLGRNYLRGVDGDRANVILSACGENLRGLLRHLASFPSFFRRFLSLLVELCDFGHRFRLDFAGRRPVLA